MLRLDLPQLLDDAGVIPPARWPAGSAARAHALAALALPVHPEVPMAESLGIGRRGLELATASGDPLVLAFAASNLGIAALAGGAPWGWELIDKALEAARESGDLRERARIQLNAAHAALWLGEYDRARFSAHAARELSTCTHCEWLARDAEMVLAEIGFRTTGASDTVSLDHTPQEPLGAFLAGRVALEAGDLDWAELALLPLADRGFLDGYPDIAGSAAGCLSRIALERGDQQASIAWAGRAVVPARAGAAAWWADTLPQAIIALLAHDMDDDAETILADATDGLSEARAPRAEAALDFGRGLMAEHAGRKKVAAAFFCRAGERYAQLPEIAPSRAITAALARL